MTVLAVAAVSARMMTEAAHRDGFEVLALDAFGDTDTRRASLHWEPIGMPGAAQIDPALTLAALRRVAQRGDAIGWVAGAGFEALPALLSAGAELLPLIGTAPNDVRRVRDPQVFFALLDRHGFAHPEVCRTLPEQNDGWLVKDFQGSGGWQVRRASECVGRHLAGREYAQRVASGVPMSATFIASGSEACVLGHNRLLTERIGHLPYVFAGVVGPVPVPAEVAHRVSQAVRTLAAAMGLRGLCSLDFLLDVGAGNEPGGARLLVLEVNPRPPASLGLYARRVAGGVMAAHVNACRQTNLPKLMSVDDRVDGQVDGHLVVYATRPLLWDERRLSVLTEFSANPANLHDAPQAGSRFDAGEPVCTLSSSGHDAAQVERRLRSVRKQLLTRLEEPLRRHTA